MMPLQDNIFLHLTDPFPSLVPSNPSIDKYYLILPRNAIQRILKMLSSERVGRVTSMLRLFVAKHRETEMETQYV